MKLAAVLLICVSLGLLGWRAAVWNHGDAIMAGDTDRNGAMESYQLADKQVRVREGQQMIWESPAEWKVEQILLADADHDGGEELLMILWKYGSYGDVKPFWHDREDRAYSCHLFMYRLQAGRMRAVWCSSALHPPLQAIGVSSSYDDKLSLVVREKSGWPFFTTRSIWQWQDWGFTRR